MLFGSPGWEAEDTAVPLGPQVMDGKFLFGRPMVLRTDKFV